MRLSAAGTAFFFDTFAVLFFFVVCHAQEDSCKEGVEDCAYEDDGGYHVEAILLLRPIRKCRAEVHVAIGVDLFFVLTQWDWEYCVLVFSETIFSSVVGWLVFAGGHT